jgi:hypothetical protein
MMRHQTPLWIQDENAALMMESTLLCSVGVHYAALFIDHQGVEALVHCQALLS